MGHPDLRTDSSDAPPSLGELLRSGDRDAVAGFYDARQPRVDAYCRELCPPDLIADAASAAWVDFLARLGSGEVPDHQLDRLLLMATRAASAGRATVEAGDLRASEECVAMPELLAAFANGELRGDHRPVREHLIGCQICELTLAWMERAERAFAQPSDDVPALAFGAGVAEIATEPEPAATPEPEPAPVPPAEMAAAPAPPPPAPPQRIVVRRRRGGLLGAIRSGLRRTGR